MFHPKSFDFLEEMKKRIDPSPFSWNDALIWVTTYPTLDPYLVVDRTTMPTSRPSMGSLTVHGQMPDGKQCHFGIVDFWDIKEGHHNPEFWWKNFNEEFDYDKNIKGHRDFDIPQNVKVELVFDDEPIDIEFRGRKPNEKVKPKMHRTEG